MLNTDDYVMHIYVKLQRFEGGISVDIRLAWGYGGRKMDGGLSRESVIR
jgi:hypothetical protein